LVGYNPRTEEYTLLTEADIEAFENSRKGSQ